MYDISTLQQMNREATEQASQENQEPYVIWDKAEIESFPPFPFPLLGDYVAPGWKMIHEYFVDSSGFGTEDEPALTAEAFIKLLKPGRGYGITGEGQFQVYVGEFVQTRRAR